MMELRDDSTCWENKTCYENNNNGWIASRDIPALTRIYSQKPPTDQVWIPSNGKGMILSKNKIEQELVDEKNTSHLMECFSPLTATSMGYAQSSDFINELNKQTINIEAQNVEMIYNCVLLIDYVNDWILQIYTTCYIRKGQLLTLDVNRKNEIVSTTDDSSFTINEFNIVSTWLPAICCKNMSRIFHQGLTDKGLFKNTETFKPKKIRKIREKYKWNEYVLLAILEIFMVNNIDDLSVPVLIDSFNTIYTPSRNSYPLLLQSLFVESLINNNINNKWFTKIGSTVMILFTRLATMQKK